MTKRLYNRGFVPITLALVLLLVAAVGLGTYFVTRPGGFNLGSKATTNSVTLAASPATLTVSANQETTAGVTINTNGESVSAVELVLSYDPANVTVVSMTLGTFFPQPITLSPFKTQNGKAILILGNQPSAQTKGVSGSGILATFKFKANKSSTISLSTSRVAAISQTDNILGVTSPFQINLPGSSAPTYSAATYQCINYAGYSTNSESLSLTPCKTADEIKALAKQKCSSNNLCQQYGSQFPDQCPVKVTPTTTCGSGTIPPSSSGYKSVTYRCINYSSAQTGTITTAEKSFTNSSCKSTATIIADLKQRCNNEEQNCRLYGNLVSGQCPASYSFQTSCSY